MEQQNSSDPSTAETDQTPPDQKHLRSYECIFCKRGFTNAQALGGHMNIHRKDKHKSKDDNKHKNDTSILTRFHDPPGYEVYFNHCIQTRDYFPVWRPDCDRKDRIGVVEDVEDLDLELRL